MLLKQRVNVLNAVVSPVHNQLYFLVSQDVQFPEQFLNGLDIRNISRKLPVIEREPGFLSKDQSQIDLREMVVILVLSVFNLP